MTGISRRNLLKGAAFSAAGVAALGLAGCAPQTEATKADAALAETGETAKHTWEVKPEPIAADQISQTVDTEVLVIGGGYSGTCCALSAAQNGAKTILVEKDAVLNGHGVGGTGAIASRALDDLGLKFDKSLEMERWVSTCGNRCRESLVGKWFRESERCMNWFLDMAEANGAKCMVTVGSNSTVHPEIACYHFMSGGPIFEEHTMADFVEYMFEAEALKAGAEFVYEMPAVQLVQDESGKVTGAICQNKSGEYVQYNASKGVVLATGDISYSDEYINEFAPVANRVFTRLCSDQGNVGDGHNMAAWAGGAFQEGPWPTMMHPQAAATFHGPFLFVNPDGKRFMNEATWVQGKCLGVMYNGGADHAWSIFDANWQNDLLGSLEHGGGMFWDTFRPYGSDYQAAVDGHTKTVENLSLIHIWHEDRQQRLFRLQRRVVRQLRLRGGHPQGSPEPRDAEGAGLRPHRVAVLEHLQPGFRLGGNRAPAGGSVRDAPRSALAGGLCKSRAATIRCPAGCLFRE